MPASAVVESSTPAPRGGFAERVARAAAADHAPDAARSEHGDAARQRLLVGRRHGDAQLRAVDLEGGVRIHGVRAGRIAQGGERVGAQRGHASARS